jgi:putative transposase
VYGARKISIKLNQMYPELKSSRYKVNKSMQKQNLVSVYCKKCKYIPYKTKAVTEELPNLVKQEFNNKTLNEVITSDLTYVPYKKMFLYICFIIDLYNREIVGYSVSYHHNTECVVLALQNANINYKKVKIFHSDRGGEFKGKELLKIFKTHKIKRSLSKPGCPYDNAVSEKLFDIYKREWSQGKYESIEELEQSVSRFVKWYNNQRIHESLGYKTPVQVRLGF